MFGWAGEVRTHEWRSQSPLPYHLATAQQKAARAAEKLRKKTAQLFKDCAVFGGVPRGIRTLGLQSHNLAR